MWIRIATVSPTQRVQWGAEGVMGAVGTAGAVCVVGEAPGLVCGSVFTAGEPPKEPKAQPCLTGKHIFLFIDEGSPHLFTN